MNTNRDVEVNSPLLEDNPDTIHDTPECELHITASSIHSSSTYSASDECLPSSPFLPVPPATPAVDKGKEPESPRTSTLILNSSSSLQDTIGVRRHSQTSSLVDSNQQTSSSSSSSPEKEPWNPSHTSPEDAAAIAQILAADQQANRPTLPPPYESGVRSHEEAKAMYKKILMGLRIAMLWPLFVPAILFLLASNSTVTNGSESSKFFAYALGFVWVIIVIILIMQHRGRVTRLKYVYKTGILTSISMEEANAWVINATELRPPPLYLAGEGEDDLGLPPYHSRESFERRDREELDINVDNSIEMREILVR